MLSLVVGGLERLVVDSSLLMHDMGINVEVCCFDELGLFSEHLTSRGINVTLLKRNPKRYDAFYFFRLARFLREKNAHVLHMHSGTFFLATQGGVLARVPAMIYTDHGRALVDTSLRMKEDRISGLFVDRIIAVSQELERYLIEIVRLPRKKTITVINGISTSEFAYRPKPVALLEEFRIPSNYNIIGTVGRIDAVKDQASLIRAFKLIRERIPRTVLVLVGDGPLRSDLENLAANEGLSGSVVFTGNRKDVPKILNLLDVFVLSSLSEGTSVSLLEAMASGVVPVVTDVGGNASIVDHAINGIVVRPKNVEQLAGAIADIIIDENKRNKLRDNAMAKVRDYYSISSMVKQYRAIYGEILGSKRRSKHLAVEI